MKPDKLDIKIQEAAAHNDSAYNELAWSRMQNLLDKEMPQKKKDQRRIFWLFLFLLFGTGVLLLITHPWKNASDAVISAKIDSANAPTSLHNSSSTESSNINMDNTQKSTLPSQSYINEIISQKSSSQKPLKNKEAQKTINDATAKDNRVEELIAYHPNNGTESERRINQPITSQEKNDKAEQPGDLRNDVETTEKDLAAMNTNENENENEKNNSLIKQDNKNTSGKKLIAPQRKNKFSNSFALSFSAGPDVSAVSTHDIGKINLAYGAGISYQFSKKFTLRTGFYFAKKSYDAKTSDYHPPTNFWNYYPDLEYIEADCKIYEVPLILNYNFSRSAKHLWFGSAGISSYFMKREDYDYFSKNALGQNSYDSYSIKNKNQHYFASIRVSAGYEKKLGNSISITTEPYLSLPIDGIGYGKVKLYGAGVLFTVNIKPFAKK
ncbi:MAG TPA: hypothetical protein VGW31_09630 [Hanamia sp.]|nr:hypothetical protein [Hanamia sp.]